MPLSDRDKEILAFEASWWWEPGPKEAAIRKRLRISPTRFYELLTALADSPDARAHDPLLVLRLRRDRSRRRRALIEGSPAPPFTQRRQ